MKIILAEADAQRLLIKGFATERYWTVMNKMATSLQNPRDKLENQIFVTLAQLNIEVIV